MSPLETRPESLVETPEEPQDPYQHWRGNLRLQPQLQTKTSDPATTGAESWEAPRNSHGDWPFLMPHVRVAVVPVLTQEGPVATQQKPRDSPFQASCGLYCYCYCSGGKRTCMSQLEMRPDSPVETPEEPQDSCQHWRGNLMFRPQLQTRT